MSRSVRTDAWPRRFGRLRAFFIAALGIALSASTVPGAASSTAIAAQRSDPSGPRLHVEAPRIVRVGDPILIRLGIRGAADVAGYEANLLYDTRAAHFAGVSHKGNGIARSGRGTMPLGGQEVPGGIAFGLYSCPASDCVDPAPAARIAALKPDFSLARVELRADLPGVLHLRLAGSRFVDASGEDVAVDDADRTVTIQVLGSQRNWVAPALPWSASTTDGDGPIRPTDLTGDELVTNGDAMAVAYAWTMARTDGDPCAAIDPKADLNGDGCIDIADLQALASRYSPAGSPATWAPRRPANQLSVPSAAPALPSATDPTSGITFTVDSTGDQPDATFGNGICGTSAGTCTLRAAMDEANRTSGGATVAFAIPGSGPHTIDIGSRLPIINNASGPLVIDGYTQPGAQPNTHATVSNAVIRVEIRGRGESNSYPGFYITSSDNTIRGLALYRLRRTIWLDGPGAHHNAIVGNFVGTNAAGTYDTPDWIRNANGAIMLDNGANNNQIGRPVLADRNVISGGPASGVYHTKVGTTENTTQNNIVGLDPSGTAKRGNELEGVDFNYGASYNLVGGTGPLERNVLSGNDGSGGEMSHGLDTTGNRFVGNFVGTNATGTRTFSYTRNGNFGIHVEDGVKDSVVTDNVIGGNVGSGVRIDGAGTRDTYVARNLIGITLDGTPAPNTVSGIRIVFRTTYGLIEENVIAHNPKGIEVRDADNDYFTFSRNSIYANTAGGGAGPGIDLSPNGVNVPWGGDPHTGANQHLDFPTLLTATTSLVTGTSCGGCRVEIFESDRGPGLYGSGRTFVGAVTANASGAFSAAVSGLDAGDVVTSTATDTDGNTSEFSRNIALQAGGGPVAADTFSRTVSERWGTAEQGGSWSHAGSRFDFAVDGNAGLLDLTAGGSNRGAHLDSLSLEDVEIVTDVRLDALPVGGSVWAYQIGRRVSNNNEYRAKLRVSASGRVFVRASRVVGGVETDLGSEVETGLTLGSGTWVTIRSRMIGTDPTTIMVKVWARDAAEPSAWQFSITDSTALLQAPGSVGLRAYLGGGVQNAPVLLRFDDFQVTVP